MKRYAILAATAALSFYATPASATLLPPASSGIVPSAFDLSTQGTLLATSSTTASALTFAGDMTSAVYLNTLGTLDFYYQVTRTGGGSTPGSDEAIQRFTTSSFAGFDVDALIYALDPDGAGPFDTANNPGLDTSTASRNASGGILEINFGANNLAGTEESATYIFRTNATAFTSGTFGVLDGSAFQGTTFAPTGAVPEPGTWMTMLAGFGAIGTALRFRRRRKVALQQLA